ncbi:MAG: hypothetical protein A07HR60_00359 [uncultured archaeon A07HR60]|nr:MAG: hypothetical protein A07HR60_00359 [uncultured archaeon A07HR60]
MSDSEPAGTNQHPTGHQSANILAVTRGAALQSAALAEISTLKTSQVRKDNRDDGLVRKLSLRIHTHGRRAAGRWSAPRSYSGRHWLRGREIDQPSRRGPGRVGRRLRGASPERTHAPQGNHAAAPWHSRYHTLDQ